jgi:hypothetical protein
MQMHVEMLDFEFVFLEIVSNQIQNLWYLSVMLDVLVRTMSSKAFGSLILGRYLGWSENTPFVCILNFIRLKQQDEVHFCWLMQLGILFSEPGISVDQSNSYVIHHKLLSSSIMLDLLHALEVLCTPSTDYS